MNNFNREAFKFENVACDLNEDMDSQFNIGWLEDEEKMMVYIKWRWESHKQVLRSDWMGIKEDSMIFFGFVCKIYKM
jgi:hypothetical protein